MKYLVEVIVGRLQIKTKLSSLSVVQIVTGLNIGKEKDEKTWQLSFSYLHSTEDIQPICYLSLSSPSSG